MHIIAQTAPLDSDMADFSGWLWQQGIPHRVSEQGGELVIRVGSAEHAAIVQQLYAQLAAGELQINRVAADAPSSSAGVGLQRMMADVPVCAILIGLSICGALLVTLDSRFEWVAWLTFTDPRHATGSWPVATQFWRWVTPVFLHFGALHICFNALWLWELGRRIELLHGGQRLLLLTLFVGVLSNAAQNWDTGAVIFGGMSGVIYGLLGYCVVWSRLRPEQSFDINPAVVIFMVAWLVLCYAGLTRIIAGVDTANTAHLSGLLCGAAVGLFAALLQRRV